MQGYAGMAGEKERKVHVGTRMMEMAVQGRRKKEGQGEGRWIWPEKTGKGLELRKETKSIGRNGKYFHLVSTPNREKPKEEEEVYNFLVCLCN